METALHHTVVQGRRVPTADSGDKQANRRRRAKWKNSRILPALVVHTIHVAILLVVWVFHLVLEYLGFVEQFVMEA